MEGSAVITVVLATSRSSSTTIRSFITITSTFTTFPFLEFRGPSTRLGVRGREWKGG
jgi:hypothetical protein